MKNKAFIIAFGMILFLTGHTNIYSQGGGAAVPFLRISPDARFSGMGEVGTAIADDINAIYWNPAGLGFHDYIPGTLDTDDDPIPYRQVALTFSPWLPQFNADLFYSYGTIGQFFEELDGTLAFNFTFMNLGEFIRTDQDGRKLGKFISNEFSLGVYYGTVVGTDVSMGFGLKYIQSNLAPASIGQSGAGTGISAAFDIGVLWKPLELYMFGEDIGDIFSIGVNLQNMGPKMTYRSESDPLPTTLRMGTSFNIVRDEFNDLKLSADFAKLLVSRDSLGSDPLPKSLITGWQNPGIEFSIGAEYWYEQIVALRAGYFTEPSRLGGRQFWNFGAGVRYDIFHLDFSFINTIEDNHPLANTMRFSMLIDWM